MSEQIPLQPVSDPIINTPYDEPVQHWAYDLNTGAARLVPGRRPASFFYQTESARTNIQQLRLLETETQRDLPLVNALREDVKRWRSSGYEGATEITKELLAYWHREDRFRRLFFCQLEAVETIIFLQEIRINRRYLRFNPQFTDEHLKQLFDQPSNPALDPLTRLGVKMATGSGKTIVMAMLIAWAFCNRGRVKSDERFPHAVLVVAPNLTIRERLQVLRPDSDDNYYDQFELVPSRLRPLLQSGRIKILNWHQFYPESENAEGGNTYSVVNKGPESAEAYAKRILGDLAEVGPIMVFNDEAHHAWRPNLATLLDGEESVDVDEFAEATIWVMGLDSFNMSVGIKFCVDLSATPFYISGSGFPEGSPFPWLVSDFGLVDAIECGIVKIPRLPISDNTGRPEPRYYRLWHQITDDLQPGEKLSNGKPKPGVVYREAEPALLTLAGQWVERFQYIKDASDTQDQTPPVLIVVCDNTDLAEVFFRKISGEELIETIELDAKGKEKTVTKTVYGSGVVFPDYFSNTESFKPTVRIDSALLAKAESGDSSMSKQDAAEQLREIVATVGKPGKPGEQVRCVVSVAMLTEGWDANNVTHIFGVRAFGSQLLCEQVVGRGLRRMDYVPDPETGKLSPEYVDIYGVPFSLIPFKGRKTRDPAPEDKPKNHVRALPERKHLEIRFPNVDSFAFALKKNVITADISSIEPIHIEPQHEPTAVFVKPRVGYDAGRVSQMTGPGEFQLHNREEFYESTHLQTIAFEITRQVITGLVGDHISRPDPRSNARLRLQSRHALFPQVYHLVQSYIETRVHFHGTDPRELGQEKYLTRIVERLLNAIEPDDTQGEAPLMPILNRYKPWGTTADVDFKTTKHCFTTQSSHINLVAADTSTWEQSAAFWLEVAAHNKQILSYAKNEQLNFTIPYEFYQISHHYVPDYLVKLDADTILIIEIKGLETEEDRQKHQAARRWISAVNNWGEMGRWDFMVCRDPQELQKISGASD